MDAQQVIEGKLERINGQIRGLSVTLEKDIGRWNESCAKDSFNVSRKHPLFTDLPQRLRTLIMEYTSLYDILDDIHDARHFEVDEQLKPGAGEE